jgi:hypothetical protein
LITRREFNLVAAGAALSLPLRKTFSLGSESADSAQRFPAVSADGNFTPFGYLDNPYHCWNIHPSGVFRSLPGVGFGLYYPAGPGGYFDYHKNGIYHAFLRLGFVIGDRTLWDAEDFREGELVSVHHSKDAFTYKVSVSGTTIHCTYFQSGEETLAARVECSRSAAPPEPFRLIVGHEYQLGGAQWWGGDGVAASYHAPSDAWITHGFAAGTVFAVGADVPSHAHFARTGARSKEDGTEPKNVNQATAYETASLRTVHHYNVTPAIAVRGITIHMSRGVNRKSALQELKRSKLAAGAELKAKYSGDAKFWNDAPRLVGDWPLHWKNGWVYDFETLRMMVRKPVGIYRHPWDAMQIQSPRSVLAESSIDMWALSYVDPTAAKAVFAGQFLDAIEPNVPCAREDGVTNMVATDGSECGTSISWCYPFFCAQSIYQRTGDREWVRVLYPKLAEFLRWTLDNRSDKDKFIIAKCSWESGMDGSKRFLINEPTGGETTEFARLVELQAATAQAATILAQFAKEIGRDSEATEWLHVREIYSAKTQQMWNGKDWFNDFDTRSMQPITSVGRDVGQVAPIFCNIASKQQINSMLPTLRNLFDASREGDIDMGQDPLLWSSLVLPYVESLWRAGQLELAGDVIHTIAERIYTSMDRRNVSTTNIDHHMGWPGVSCEVWGAEGARGGEGYGWGAVMPAHIIRNILGLHETEDPYRILVAPNLPRAFMTSGTEYGISSLSFRPGKLSLRYAPRDEWKVEVAGTCSIGSVWVEDTSDGSRVATSASCKFSFEAQNRRVYRLHWLPTRAHA